MIQDKFYEHIKSFLQYPGLEFKAEKTGDMDNYYIYTPSALLVKVTNRKTNISFWDVRLNIAILIEPRVWDLVESEYKRRCEYREMLEQLDALNKANRGSTP